MDTKLKKIEELCDTCYTGTLYKTLIYRSALISAFLDEISNKNSEVTEAFLEWLKICDLFNLELPYAILLLYKEGHINDIKCKFYEEYFEYFDKMTEMLLGDYVWRPNEKMHEFAEKKSLSLYKSYLNSVLTLETTEENYQL